MAVAAPAADSVVPFGDASLGVNALAGLDAPIVGMAATPDGQGYWMVAADGGIFAYGDAHFFGSTGNIRLNQPVVGMAATPDGKGYWMVAADGGIFAYGDAHFYGSTGNIRLNQPVVGMAATPDGKGYWLVAADGGIFAFGDAHFYGSTGNIRAQPAGGGHGRHARRKGLLAGGGRRRDLRLRRRSFFGSTGDDVLNQPVVGMAAGPGGKGYWLVAADGGIFSFGAVSFFGSEGAGRPAGPAVGIVATPSGGGYWLVFGSARALAGKVVGIDPGHNGLNYTAPQIIDQPVWNGQEDESCDTTGTETAGGYTEAQFNFNVASYLQIRPRSRRRHRGDDPPRAMTASVPASPPGPPSSTMPMPMSPWTSTPTAVRPTGRGFAVLEPVADGPNNGVIASSADFGSILRDTFAADTPHAGEHL